MTCIPIRDGVVTVGPARTWNLRTRAGREAEVLAQIEQFKGFTVFWATENRIRARAIVRLERSGRIERVAGDQFPWCSFRVIE